MDYLKLVESMSPEIYQNIVRSVERGKWPDGKLVTPEQRENAMLAIIAWGEKYLPETERVGYIEKKKKAGEVCDTPEETPLNWKDQER